MTWGSRRSTPSRTVYTEDFVFDRGAGQHGARSRDEMVALVDSDAHRTAIAGGLAHFGTCRSSNYTATPPSPPPTSPSFTPDEKGEERELANHWTSTRLRIHRVLANRWSLVTKDGRWLIRSRTILPMDGSGPALEMARQAATYYADR